MATSRKELASVSTPVKSRATDCPAFKAPVIFAEYHFGIVETCAMKPAEEDQ